MTNEHIQALKTKSVDRIIAEIKAKHSHYDAYAPVMTWGEFCTIVTERAADKALIAEQEKRIAEVEQKADIYDMLRTDYELDGSLVEFVDWQAKRIAELEREKEVMTATALAMRDDMREARTLTVKLPKRATADKYVDGTFDNSDLAAIYNTCRLECEVKIKNACAAAGITLVVGE